MILSTGHLNQFTHLPTRKGSKLDGCGSKTVVSKWHLGTWSQRLKPGVTPANLPTCLRKRTKKRKKKKSGGKNAWSSRFTGPLPSASEAPRLVSSRRGLVSHVRRQETSRKVIHNKPPGCTICRRGPPASRALLSQLF